jgi:ribonuclease Z
MSTRRRAFAALLSSEAGDQKLLIDAGRGAAARLHQLHVPLGRVDALLRTPYHSDHTSGIPDVRIADEKLPPEGIAMAVEEFDRDGVVYEKNGVKVIACEVVHRHGRQLPHHYAASFRHPRFQAAAFLATNRT